jgi:beta-galactosidase
MTKRTIFLLFAFALMTRADEMTGFLYGVKKAPDGTEWQSPEALSLNKEQPRAYLFPFADKEQALKVLPEESSYFQSLDGTWKFHWVPSPDKRPADFYRPDFDVKAWDDIKVPGCWNVLGLQKDGTMKYGVPIYVNQPVIFYHEVKENDWREGVMRQPKDPRYTTYQYPNEVGSYRRTFQIPQTWKGRDVFINFDGVDSFFYLWINGIYVGFSKNSRNTARFNITPYLNPFGENVLAVEVYRSSDGSFLEAQDMFRLPGIFRSTYLTAMSKVHISDMAVRTTQIGGNANVNVNQRVGNATEKEMKGIVVTYSVFPVGLYTDATGDKVYEKSYTLPPLQKRHGFETQVDLPINNPQLWSAEAPYRYVLVAELKDKKGKLLDCTSTYFGIRTVEIKDTPAGEDEFGLAGRYFYVNGKPVKLKGVNRHETNPSTGHAISREQMQQEVMLMKRGNINHVRLSHYSNDPYWYYLCDKYGLYLEDECNIESHEYYYGKESLSHPKEWRAAHVGRNLEMVHAHVNHPSIVIWSLGNEAGPGDNFKAAYEAIKEYDKSRPVQYERNNDIVDMGSNQYPSVAWVQQVAKGKSNVKYPYHISEYAHSMGNSLGNLVDYWKAIESSNFFCGAAIWDWVDQAIDTYTKDGQKYMGYGGDHGDWPNDGMFCMNGIMLPDLSPKPQYFEVKKVYQNVGVTLNGAKETNGKMVVRVMIFNKNYFEPIAHNTYDIVACLIRDGKKVNETKISLSENILPRKEVYFLCPVDMSEQGEYFLNVEFRLASDKPWAKKGYVQMDEQLPLGKTGTLDSFAASSGTLKVTKGKTETAISGKGFSVTFDNSNGSLSELQYDGTDVIASGNGPKLDAFRAPVDNDNWAWNSWFQNGLYDLHHKAQGAPIVVNNTDGSKSVVYTVVSQARTKGEGKRRAGKAGQPFESVASGQEMKKDDFHFTTTQRYTVFPDGSIHVSASIISSDASVVLPRLGYAMKLPKDFEKYTYYGRGPLNNYADRKTGSFIGLYQSTVEDQFVNFPKPQSMGNREDVRWCALQNKEGKGALFVSQLQNGMSVSALPWSAVQMTFAAHPHELPASDGTYLHLDCQVTGLGGNSCGQGGPLQPDRVMGSMHQMKYMIRPIKEADDLTLRAKVLCDIPSPVSISRDRSGKVTIQGDTTVNHPKSICYQITKAGTKTPGKVVTVGAEQQIATGIALRSGGTVTAWYKGDATVKTTARFSKIENVPVEIAYVSSEEGPGGEVAKNLVDNNPSTIWHTMYSITVPKYPHMVDFDCNEIKTLKGFTYLPRQDGSQNGNIKGYKVQVSRDGKNWGDTVCEGNFENNAKEQKVLFTKPVKARYLRFTALSSQNGNDFASGAEFTVIAE